MSTNDASSRSTAPDLAAALFGADSREELTGRWIVFFITFCLALAGLLALRRPDALLNPQFWAEDGNLFFAEQFYGQTSLFKPYAGYLTLIPRLAAKLADLFPVLWAPLLYNAFSLVLASITCAWLALPHFRHLIQDDKLRLLACLLIALMPSIGPILANLNNLQYYLTIGCCLICLQPFPGGVGKYLLLGLYLILLLTTPTAVILAPLWLLRAWVLDQDRKASLTMVAVHGIYIVLVKIWVSASARTFRAFHPLESAISAAKLILTRVGIMGLFGPKFFAPSFFHQKYFLIPMGVCLLMFMGAVLWRARFQKRFLIQTGLFVYLIFSSVALFTLIRTGNPAADLYFTVGGARYFVLGTALFYIWLLSALDRMWPDRWVRAGIIGLIVLLGFTVKQHFAYVQTFEDLQWPRWAQGFEQARQSRARFPLDVPINPRPWVIPGSGRLPPDTLSLAVPLEPSSMERAEKINNSWRSVGSHAVLNFTLDRPQYVFAIRLRYASTCPAQLAWRSALNQPFLHDAKLQLLPPAGADGTTQTVWIADGLQEFQIALGPSPCELELSEISLLASPHPLR